MDTVMSVTCPDCGNKLVALEDLVPWCSTCDGFWVGEKVWIDAFDYKGYAILDTQIGEQFHVRIEGQEGTLYFKRNEVKKIVGDA